MYLKSIIFTAFFAVVFYQTSSGINCPAVPDGKQLVDSGIVLYDAGKLKESVEMYNQVNKCDPNFASACYETALSFQQLGEYEKAYVKVCEADSLNSDQVTTLILKGSILDDLGRYNEAIQLLENTRKKWPYNQNLIYNLAIVYANVKNYLKAEQLLIESIKLAPYHAGSHLLLGRVNYYMGRNVQAVLAYNLGLLISPSRNNITRFENVLSQKTDIFPTPYLYPFAPGSYSDEWKTLNQLINSGISLQKNFPYNYDLNFSINRQTYMVMSSLQYNESDTTLYNQYYNRLFCDIYNKGYFEMMAYFQLQNLENDKVNAWLKSNSKKQEGFIQLIQSDINSWKEFRFNRTNENNGIKVQIFNDNGNIYAFGQQKTGENPKFMGEYTEIDHDGAISEKGNYVDGKLQGNYKLIFPDGKLKQELSFTDSKLNGENRTYYNSGKLSGIYPRVKGEANGVEKLYTQSGRLYHKQSFVAGKAEGENYHLYTGSGYSIVSNYKNGKLEGSYTEKWLNGKLKTETNYHDSIMTGDYKKWYSNGKPESVNKIKNDSFYGPFTLYYTSGEKKAEGTYNDSTQLEGKYIEYYKSGIVKLIQDNYSKGELTGTQTDYYPNGTKKAEITYEKNKITKLSCYDLNSKIIYTANPENTKLHFRTYYDNGSIKREGDFVNGSREGEWKEYSGAGVITSIENWRNDVQIGKQRLFHDSGILKAEYSMNNGKVDGIYTAYYADGSIKQTGNYTEGEAHGIWKYYHSNGKIQTEMFLNGENPDGRKFDYTVEGKLQSVTNYLDEDIRSIAMYSDGNFQQLIDFSKDSVAVEILYSNSKPKCRYTLIDGLYHGNYECFYPNGKLQLKRTFYLNQLSGESKSWDIFGRLNGSSPYNMGKLDGQYYSYDNGKIESTGFYVENQEEKAYIEYHKNGKVYRIIPYQNGVREGKYQYFSQDSVLLFSFNYNEGSICSVTYRDKNNSMQTLSTADKNCNNLTSYYPDGKKAAEIPVTTGFLNGSLKIWYNNGNLMRERIYLNDASNGTYCDYFENGKVKEKFTFKNGDQNGAYEKYYDNGLLMEKGEYISDMKTGIWYYYDVTGKQIYKVRYLNDEVHEML